MSNRDTIKTRIWQGGALLLLIVLSATLVDTFRGLPGEDPVSDPSTESASHAKRVSIGGHRSAPGSTGGPDSAAGQPRKPSAESMKADQKKHILASLRRRNELTPGLEDKLSMPEWEKIINPGGTLKDEVDADGMFGSNGLPDFIDLYHGVEAEFIQENISNGVATDMSALLIGSKLEDEVLYNGAVRAEHDLGNAYVLATVGEDGHLRIYAGVERLITSVGTFIEFEFNQNRVHLSSGSPWPLNGERRDGDVLVRMIFSDRVLQSVQLEQWQQGAFRFLDTGGGISGESCMEMKALMYCVGVPPIQHPEEGFEVWDEDNNSMDPVLADDFVEIGIDVDLLAGPQSDITSVLFRTPEDIALNSFQVFERLALLERTGGSMDLFSSQ